MITRQRLALAEIDPDTISANAINAFERSQETVNVACQFSDEDVSVGKYYLGELPMLGESRREHLSRDDFLMSFNEDHQARILLVEIGNTALRGNDETWLSSVDGTGFLQGGLIIDEDTDYVFGEDGELIHRNGHNKTVLSTQTTNTIFHMDGATGRSSYAVGGGGLLLKVEDGTCKQIDLGHNLDLRTVLTTKDAVFFGGNQGYLAKLANDEIVEIEHKTAGDILAMCVHKDHVYVADSEFGLVKLIGEEIEPVAELGYVWRITSGERYLTCSAGEFILQFDGEKWRGIELFFDGGMCSREDDLSVFF